MTNHGGVREGAGRPKGESSSSVRIPTGCRDAVEALISEYKKQNLLRSSKGLSPIPMHSTREIRTLVKSLFEEQQLL